MLSKIFTWILFFSHHFLLYFKCIAIIIPQPLQCYMHAGLILFYSYLLYLFYIHSLTSHLMFSCASFIFCSGLSKYFQGGVRQSPGRVHHKETGLFACFCADLEAGLSQVSWPSLVDLGEQRWGKIPGLRNDQAELCRDKKGLGAWMNNCLPK